MCIASPVSRLAGYATAKITASTRFSTRRSTSSAGRGEREAKGVSQTFQHSFSQASTCPTSPSRDMIPFFSTDLAIRPEGIFVHNFLSPRLPFLNHVLLSHRPPRDARGHSAKHIPEQGSIKPGDGVAATILQFRQIRHKRPGVGQRRVLFLFLQRAGENVRQLETWGDGEIETDVGVDHRINGLAPRQ